ncbi:MAG: polysaccharide deacetylase family protein [Actinobacteria bacterium]|nr:polysaccharide deacetylase family protein [Actinomycetota bacterium]
MGKFKKAINKFVNLFFYYLGFYYILRFINRKKIRVLMYHGVDDRQTDFILDDPSLVISTKNFEEQIKYLSKSYNIISTHDLAAHIKKEIPFPSNSAVITFDDGLKNNFVNAFPILQKYDAKATVFLITDYIDTLKISWSNKFYFFINKIGLDEFVEEFEREFPAYSNLIEKIGQKNITENINFILKYKVDDNIKEKFIQGLYNKFRIKINKKEIKDLYLSWKEIKKMADAGISFGSHTSTHPVLSTLNYEKAKKEIVDSKQNIEAKLNKKINLFAYPYGDKDSFDLNNKKILINYNFLCAVSTIEGFNNLNSDLYELKRISIVDEPFYYFKLRIEGLEGLIEKIQHKVYRYFKRIKY